MYLPLRAAADSIGDDKISESNNNSSDPVITYNSTNENGIKFYALVQLKQNIIVNFVEQRIKDGDDGISIIAENLKYAHTAEFSDYELYLVMSDNQYRFYE